ncbi:hypothetical protein IP81_13565 [Novosphingobium sp. AAP83]|uniref:hypothetical protein n=1 Tax=Novosphingobium sp. AAP83 TaxID=1523425 RepID=UPI0006B8E901|nr:hypothetical protein [Novosphingobium sp. AAP83]KPF91189.1 hypothetical protein IP81_13565 [Novosphingobium sp. AAP83]
MHNQIKATTALHTGVKPRRAHLMLLPALLLAGCGSSPSPNADLEARLAAVEAKAEQAEQRSKEALSLAASGSSSSSGGFSEPEEMPEETGSQEEGFGDSPSPPTQMIGPPSPGQGGPPGQF